MEKYTFGNTPACIYLVHHLEEIGNPIINRKVGKTLTSFRTLLNQLEQSHCEGNLNAHNFAAILNKIRQDINVSIADELTSNLTKNIIIGEIKSLIRKVSNIRRIETLQKRIINNPKFTGDIYNKQGQLIVTKNENQVTYYLYKSKDLNDTINAETLTNKWKEKMKKHPHLQTKLKNLDIMK